MAVRSLSENIARWRVSPASMVRELFGTEPDLWQVRVLEAFPTNQRMAMKACKGPGKTCLLAWLCWNFLICYRHPKIAATSITSDNLSDGLWSEMAKWWQKAPILREAFEWTKTRIFNKDDPENWFMSARTWPKGSDATAQADTLAGLHADNMMFVIDEAGGIPDAVMAAAEAGLANAGIEGRVAHIVIAGNPTHLEGPLYRATTRESHLWHLTEITADPDDPMRTPRVSVQWAREQIEKYGKDSPWVLVNVFGRFPPSSIDALIGPDEVRAAMRLAYPPNIYVWAPMILGVDVARQGDDCSVIFPRQGLMAFRPDVMRNVETMRGASTVGLAMDKYHADAVNIDGTGGYGAGWIDALRGMKRKCNEVQFAGRPFDMKFNNKRSEMWWQMAAWIRAGGQLPDMPELVAELTAATVTFKGDKFCLDGKDDIKERIGRSPDLADALACTFAFPVATRDRMAQRPGYAVM